MLNWLYNLIGRKVQMFAKVSMILGSVACVICAVVLLVLNPEFLPISVLMILIGPVCCWLSSFMLYAFGKIAECNEAQCEILLEQLAELKKLTGKED